MHRLLKILLAIMVISCPLRCQLGLSDCCGEAITSSPSECCCDDSGMETPVFPVEETEDKCGCLCSGATMPDAADLFTQESVQFEVELISFLLSDVMSVHSDNESRTRWCAFEMPVCARNIGRQMRCLHGSFII